jgi:hypothetical protein
LGWEFHRISMGFPWDFHRISMGYPWDFHGFKKGVLIGISRDFHRI